MIYLIGMPGVGKSYWSKKIANYLQIEAIDLDAKIEQVYQTTINALIAKSHDDFRQKESECLRNIPSKKCVVISCGGGTPCFHDNIHFMLQRGIVIWIHDDIKNIEKRLKEDNNKRPLLTQTTDLNKSLQDLFTRRKPFYELATLKMDVNNPNSVNFVLTAIKEHINNQ